LSNSHRQRLAGWSWVSGGSAAPAAQPSHFAVRQNARAAVRAFEDVDVCKLERREFADHVFKQRLRVGVMGVLEVVRAVCAAVGGGRTGTSKQPCPCWLMAVASVALSLGMEALKFEN